MFPARFILYGAVLGLLCGWAFPLPSDSVVWNTTASMPLGLYWRIPAGPLVAGDLVEFRAPDSWLDPLKHAPAIQQGVVAVLKTVRGIAGETVCWGDDALHTCQSVPPGHIFVMGTHPKSLDSRTLGPIDRRLVRWRLLPLWTWE